MCVCAIFHERFVAQDDTRLAVRMHALRALNGERESFRFVSRVFFCRGRNLLDFIAILCIYYFESVSLPLIRCTPYIRQLHSHPFSSNEMRNFVGQTNGYSVDLNVLSFIFSIKIDHSHLIKTNF